MKAVRLTLICHALTQAQKVGRLHRTDDGILPLTQQPDAMLPGMQLLAAPERRACETATWLAGQVQVEPGLADCDLGHWQGLSLKQLQAEHPKELAQWLADPGSDVHGGESFIAVRQRLACWLEAFEEPGEWLAVTHPMVIRAVLMNLMDSPASAFHAIDVLPLSRLALSRAGRWRLRITPGLGWAAE
ncbi:MULTISPECIES: histidine phosphatase family protein [Pseudomonas]|uniref:histidine phosphatase family protein n=1 Tax=Pseudomonas TaxID=286 RepID=UPI0018E6693C|nr:histidine phosphatase family protein [Pseudomonas sp.]MBI6922788.1 histidine phosphatase family protein [Pseudomonas monteilii]MCE0937780.1 histidine phosphatase family protein [Pseudomonas kurunegalensis]